MSRYSGTSSKSAFEPPDSAVTESRCGFVRVSGVSACVSRSEDAREDPASSSGFAACLCAPRKCLNSASSTCPCCTGPGACFVLPCRPPPGQAKSRSVRPRQQARARAARAQAQAARLDSTDLMTQWAARRVALLACSSALAKDPPFDHSRAAKISTRTPRTRLIKTNSQTAGCVASVSFGTLSRSKRSIPNETRSRSSAFLPSELYCFSLSSSYIHFDREDYWVRKQWKVSCWSQFKFVRRNYASRGCSGKYFCPSSIYLVRPPHHWVLPTLAMDPKKLKLAVKEVRARAVGLCVQSKVRNTAKAQAFSRRARAVAHLAFIC